TGAARCPGPTNPGAAGGTLTTRLILRCCDMSSPSEINSPFNQNAYRTGACATRVPYRRSCTQHASTIPLILRRNLCLRRSLRAENLLETFAVLQENQNPQHASNQRGRDALRRHRQVKRKDVVEFRSQQRHRKWHESAEKQQQPAKHLPCEEERGKVRCDYGAEKL